MRFFYLAWKRREEVALAAFALLIGCMFALDIVTDTHRQIAAEQGKAQRVYDARTGHFVTDGGR